MPRRRDSAPSQPEQLGRPSTILIRVDGSDRIGMGHVMRCWYLVRELQRRAPVEAAFVMKDLPLGAPWVASRGYPVHTLPAAASAEAEIDRVRRLVEEKGAACVMTDLRELPPGLIDAIKAAGALAVTIDEWGNRAISADILTNGTIVPGWHRYELNGDVDCRIGAAYTLLDRQFAEAHAQGRSRREGPPQVLVALGGDDPFRLTAKAMRALERLAAPLRATVVIGPAFTNQEEIRGLAARAQYACQVLENVSTMAVLMRQADAAIVGGGLMALEAACTGTPALILCEVSHQLETADALRRQGAAVDLGFGVAISEEELARRLSAVLDDATGRAAMSEAGARLVDGRGCERLAEVLLSRLAHREMADVPEPVSVPVGR